MPKHIIIVHGRSTKPRREEKVRLVLAALRHGLTRAGFEVEANAVGAKIPVSVAYYGDVNNAVLWAAAQRPRRPIAPGYLDWPYTYEADGSYDADLARLFELSNGQQNRRTYSEYKRRYRDQGAFEEVADLISPIAGLFGISDNVINRFLPDLGAYFGYRMVGSEVRQRLQALLVPALERGDEVCLVAHSMGSVVAYDVLWKLSRMSEYAHLHDARLSLFVTLGSPLGEPGVRTQLYDSNEPDDGCFPNNIVHWHNFAAADDFVSHDQKLADDFARMRRTTALKTLKDHFIYTFWVGSSGLNPHKLYGYLDHHSVGRTLGEWLNS